MFIDEKILNKNGLRYSSRDDLVVKRLAKDETFNYQNENGKLVSSAKQISWYESLAVPPVYEDVCFCADQKGHLQASGKDTTGNIQYFYHPNWEDLRDQYKFERLFAIGEALPSIRRKVRQHLKTNQGEKLHVLAAITRVLDNTGLRIGNEESKNENNTYGVSTLKKEHINHNNDGSFSLEFTGKGGVEIEREIQNSGVKNILESFYERPGDLLFQYKDKSGLNAVSPAQINNYISKISKIDMTAKEFRTWRSSAMFVKFWLQSGGKDKSLGQLLENVCEYIGNTPATLRNSYIHPYLANKKKDESFSIVSVKPQEINGLRKAEKTMLALLNDIKN